MPHEQRITHCFGTFIPLFFQLYSTSKFKIKSKTCSVSNHLSNKMLYLKIIGYEMGVALLVDFGDLFLDLALLEDDVQAGVYLCQWITVSLPWVDLSLSWRWLQPSENSCSFWPLFSGSQAPLNHCLSPAAVPQSSNWRQQKSADFPADRQGQDSLFLFNGRPVVT